GAAGWRAPDETASLGSGGTLLLVSSTPGAIRGLREARGPPIRRKKSNVFSTGTPESFFDSSGASLPRHQRVRAWGGLVGLFLPLPKLHRLLDPLVLRRACGAGSTPGAWRSGVRLCRRAT